MEVGVPNVEIDARNVEVDVRNSEIGVRNVEVGVRNVEVDVRNSEIGVRNVEIDARNSEIGVRSLETGARNSEVSKGGIFFCAAGYTKAMYKVFLVEDEIVVREGIRNSVPWGKIPYTLAGEAPDGEMALPVIQDLKPDILITDIRMPFMDGLELSRLVKREQPGIKIIILSGHDEFDYARQAISVGVEEYLLKPVSVKDLVKALDKVAARISEEQEKLRHIESLRERLEPARNAPPEKNAFTPADLGGVDGDLFLTRLKYAPKKEAGNVLAEYAAPVADRLADSPMLAYFVFAEIVVAASKFVESLGGKLAEIVPFSLNQQDLMAFAASRETFFEKGREMLESVMEWRDARAGGRYSAVIMKAREYLEAHFASEDMSLSAAASYVGISPNHLSAVFVQETGERFIDCLTRLRIERAQWLLENTAAKSADIACEAGFRDPHYFSCIFKKNTGVSPREYRLAGEHTKKTNEKS